MFQAVTKPSQGCHRASQAVPARANLRAWERGPFRCQKMFSLSQPFPAFPTAFPPTCAPGWVCVGFLPPARVEIEVGSVTTHVNIGSFWRFGKVTLKVTKVTKLQDEEGEPRMHTNGH